MRHSQNEPNSGRKFCILRLKEGVEREGGEKGGRREVKRYGLREGEKRERVY